MDNNSKQFKDNYKYNVQKILEIMKQPEAKNKKNKVVGEKKSGRNEESTERNR